MMATTLVRVFVSSTWVDLQPERLAVERALHQMRETKFVGMEYFGTRDETTRGMSLDEVDRSDLYIGVFGARYGSGITEEEYRRARAKGVPCFVYHKAPEPGQEVDRRVEELRREHERDHGLRPPFANPDQLAAAVAIDLHRWVFDHKGLPGEYDRLRDAYIDPTPVFERVRLDRFAGRGWLVEKVDAFLRGNDRGVLVLEAEAGLGKTAFLAHLVKQRGYLHHFCELARGPDGVALGVRNLASQLVRAWDLNPYAVEGALSGTAIRPRLLDDLLRDAARRRDASRPGEPIVLVVDALDESAAPGLDQNVLALPTSLPAGAFLIVSQRPVDVRLEVDAPREVLPLRADDPANLADMRSFLESTARDEAVARMLADAGHTADEFVATLLAKSEGLWIYLHYVVAEIEAGKRLPLRLDDLPQGVWQYYARFWRHWQSDHADSWDTLDQLLLSTLAAVEEAISRDQLQQLTALGPSPLIRRRLDLEWTPFLAAVRPVGAAPMYRLYHASLREFFNGSNAPSHLTRSERALTEELSEAVRSAHTRIVDSIFLRWGGLAAALPGVRALSLHDPMDRYGLRHLATHLELAGRSDDLHTLLRLEWREQPGVQAGSPPSTGPPTSPPTRDQPGEARYVNAWFAAHDRTDEVSSYLADVARAWSQADCDVTLGGSPAPVGLQYRCALLTASLRSLAGNIPASLLAILVGHLARVWP